MKTRIALIPISLASLALAVTACGGNSASKSAAAADSSSPKSMLSPAPVSAPPDFGSLKPGQTCTMTFWLKKPSELKNPKWVGADCAKSSTSSKRRGYHWKSASSFGQLPETLQADVSLQVQTDGSNWFDPPSAISMGAGSYSYKDLTGYLNQFNLPASGTDTKKISLTGAGGVGGYSNLVAPVSTNFVSEPFSVTFTVTIAKICVAGSDTQCVGG